MTAAHSGTTRKGLCVAGHSARRWRSLIRYLSVLVLLGVLAAGQADPYYQTTKRKVSETRFKGLQRIVKELRNSTDRSIGYDYDFEKEMCWSWSVSASVLDRFNIASARQGCRSTGTYSTSGWLDPGKTLRVMGQAIRDYETYLAQRLRVWDDGRSEVVDSTYATIREDFEQYWRAIVSN